jgi:hypothetical protein
VAAMIKSKLGVEPELIEGGRGEFTVWLDDELIAKKGWFKFPSEEKIIAELKTALS